MASSYWVLSLAVLLLFSTSSWPAASADDNVRDFVQCLSRTSANTEAISSVTYSLSNSSFTSILNARIDNLRFTTSATPKPLLIITPTQESQIQTMIWCARKTGVSLRIRGGGHDFEGQSYRATEPFVMLDMINFRSLNIDLKSSTAWVGAGLTLGELYYRISEKSSTLGFPAGLWSTVGVSGFLGGGGYGMLKRKYALAGDNTLDIRFIDANGRILDRKSMGEDLFWAIRGGGISSFGIAVSWRIQLVPVPKTVTRFGVGRTLEQDGAELYRRWQSIAPNFEERDLDVRCVVDTITSASSTRGDKKTVRFVFQSLFLGTIDRLIPIMQKSFPELGLVKEDCIESSWIESAPFFSNFSQGTPPEILLNRNAIPRNPYKGKSSFVRVPISAQGLNGVWDRMLQLPTETVLIQYTPFGGKMNEYSETSLPFPHRPGVLYMINIGITLDNDVTERLQWINDLFNYYTPYVTQSPRTSYVNYIDLDIGQGSKTYAEASVWGRKYFGKNFDRLLRVKAAVDPTNFFRHGQSIPVLSI
ncbi:Berberine bridge enzyme [Heracleum sosnowskyi]|uniref:Berberine bridge enzyme n=1 Tax=Heracleum sosnowskyi TaxID=360622 RepID=A0AAD8MFY9_9APIA|nr:Berberine bridge enzyme [Heracleum sosnowskyi]